MNESSGTASPIDPAAATPANTISVSIPLEAPAMPVDGSRN
jgi:hypothetical protein